MTTERYKVVNGAQVIEIRINDVQQLFDSRDPAPFREKDLDENFTHYLEAYLDELVLNRPLKLQIYIANSSSNIQVSEIKEAIYKYFEYQIQIKRGQYSKAVRMGQLFLLIGLCVLFLCLALAQLTKKIESEFIRTTMREGVVIFGWVSMWKPLDVLLFDWYPIYDRIRIYRRLMGADIEIIFEDHRKSLYREQSLPS